MPPITQDLLGSIFGRLTVTEFIGIVPINNLEKYTKKKAAVWKCQCSCGNYVDVKANFLKRGVVKSCGCLREELKKTQLQRIGKLNAKPKGEAAFNYLLNRYKTSAKKRGHYFDLTREQVKSIFAQCCFYCGEPPSQVAMKNWYHGDYIYNGIDRVDNDLGYVVGNVVACCGRCNKAKGKDTPEQFRDWIKKAYEFNYGNIN